MPELLYKDLSYAIIGAAMEVHKRQFGIRKKACCPTLHLPSCFASGTMWRAAPGESVFYARHRGRSLTSARLSRIHVHNVLGSGFLESVYQTALEKELMLRGIPFERKVKLPVSCKGELIGEYEADFVVDGKIVIEIKSVSRFNPAHEAQAIHYLTATGMQLALLVNFGAGSLEYRRIIKSKKQIQKSASISEIRGINSLDEQ